MNRLGASVVKHAQAARLHAATIGLLARNVGNGCWKPFDRWRHQVNVGFPAVCKRQCFGRTDPGRRTSKRPTFRCRW